MSEEEVDIESQIRELVEVNGKLTIDLILNEYLQNLMSEQERSDNIRLPAYFTASELLATIETDFSIEEKELLLEMFIYDFCKETSEDLSLDMDFGQDEEICGFLNSLDEIVDRV